MKEQMRSTLDHLRCEMSRVNEILARMEQFEQFSPEELLNCSKLLHSLGTFIMDMNPTTTEVESVQ